MTILKMATADYQDLTLLDAITEAAGTVTISSDYARTGTYSYKVGSGSSNSFSLSVPGSPSEVYIRVACYCSYILTDSYAGLSIVTYNDIQQQANVRFFQRTGIVKAYRSSTIVDSAAGSEMNEWNVFEVYFKLHDSSGRMVVKVDGTQVIDFTGDTLWNGSAIINSITLGTSQSTDYSTVYLDDIVIADEWPGRGGIYVLTPNAGSTTENWTPSTGNPEDCVDEQPPSYTDYISTDTSVNGTDQLFGFESLGITPTSIGGINVVSSAQLDSAGSTYAMSIINSNGNKASGDPVGLSTDSSVVSGIFSTNPDGDVAWTKTAIDALEAGIESVVP
jgi:hypothetical protein